MTPRHAIEKQTYRYTIIRQIYLWRHCKVIQLRYINIETRMDPYIAGK